jgi:peptide chain release factor 3
VSWAGVRWLKFKDKKVEDKFCFEYNSVIMEDKEKRICYAVRTEWDLRLAQEKNPDVSFFKNSDYIE